MPLRAMFVCVLCLVAAQYASAAGFRPIAPNEKWVLPDVGPITEEDVIRRESGRTLCRTPDPTIKFWVMAPRTYSPERPAGLLLYFHGGGGVPAGEDANPWFHNLEGGFSQDNFIWLKMSFERNGQTGGPQFENTLYAIAKVRATYKIVAGRGVLAGFSAGGRHMSYFVNQTGGWPFCHVTPESGLFYSEVPTMVAPMSWTYAVSQDEWQNWGLGRNASQRFSELAREMTENAGSWDLHLHVVAGEGHNVILNEKTLQATVAAFRRSDTFLAPFVYAPDYTETELKPIAEACNARRLGQALVAAQEAATGQHAGQAQELLDLMAQRVDAMFTALNELKEKDPVLAAYYAGQTAMQLEGHPRQVEARDLLAAIQAAPAFERQRQLTLQWCAQWPGYLDDAASVHLLPEQKAALEEYRSALPPESLVGRMAGEFLELGTP